MTPVGYIKNSVGDWEQQHTDFVYHSNSSLGNMHTKRVAIDTQFQFGPKSTKGADWFDMTVAFLWELEKTKNKELGIYLGFTTTKSLSFQSIIYGLWQSYVLLFH